MVPGANPVLGLVGITSPASVEDHVDTNFSAPIAIDFSDPTAINFSTN